MTRHKVLAVVAALLSAGWTIPLLLGVDAYLSFWQAEGWPLLLGKQHPGNSFPYIHFAAQYLRAAFAWLGVVVFFWAYTGCVALRRGRAA